MSEHTQVSTDAAQKQASVTDLCAERQSRNKAARDASNRRFDHKKVARLKAEIAAGTYQIDYPRVARKFIEHERNGA